MNKKLLGSLFDSPVSVKLLLIGTLYPGWSILLRLALPNEYNAIAERFVIGAVAIICMLVLRSAPKFQKYGAQVVGAIILLMTTHFVILVFRSGVSYVYVVGMLVYTTAVGALIDSSRFYLVYAANYLVGTGLVCLLVAPSKEAVVMLMAGLTTQAVIFLLILFSREKLEEEIRANRLSLEASKHFASLGRFASGVAHEINNPLTVVIGNAEFLRAMMAAEPVVDKERGLNLIDRVIAMSFRAAKIVSSLLVLTRPLTETAISSIGIEQLVDLVKESIEKELAAVPGVTFSVKVGNASSSVRCCRQELVNALSNLIKNSLDQFSGLETGAVTLEISETRTEFVFSIIDSGPGVSVADRDKIFQPFFTTKPVGGGEGLGLPVALGITLKHSGALFLDESKKATTFVLSIPRNLTSTVGVMKEKA